VVAYDSGDGVFIRSWHNRIFDFQKNFAPENFDNEGRIPGKFSGDDLW
jgi:hypothetical protein